MGQNIVRSQGMKGAATMKSDIIHIVYASDQNFAYFLGVSIVSLFENNLSLKEINLHILDCGIERQDKEKIEAVCNNYGRTKPHWIQAENISRELQMAVDADRGSLAQFARIFLSRHLDSEINRVLYIDCDTICKGSLYEMWNLDMKGKTVAALKDAFSKYYRMNINLQQNDLMFNSGVMLVDMTRWREHNVENHILNFIKERNGFVEKGDQGALNAVLSHDCLCFDPTFNAITIFFDFNYSEMLRYRRPPQYYTEEQLQNAVDNPVIIHYTISFLSKRPWMKGCKHRYVDEWLKYKAMSPWSDMPLMEEKRSWRVRAIRKLPRGLMLWIAGILQVYGRPWLYWIRSRRVCHKGFHSK